MRSRRQPNPNPPKSRRCTGGRASLDVGLQIMAENDMARIKPSKKSKRRAAVLIGVHLLIVGHVAHFLLAGKTLSPTSSCDGRVRCAKSTPCERRLPFVKRRALTVSTRC